MAVERLISGTERPEEEQFNFALRPRQIGEFVGQKELIERLSISLKAAQSRGEPLEHLLLHGPPGLGKTTLAHVIAKEMGTRVVLESGPTLAKGTDLVAALTSLQHGDVLFIDEIHRLPIAVEEFIYPAMEDFRVDVRIDSGMNANTVHLKLKPFTLIGATTRSGLLSSPMRSRFGLTHHFRFYHNEELASILARSADLLTFKLPPESLRTIAARSRGTPRIANRLLRRVRDYAQVKSKGDITPAVVESALMLEGIDALGLDELDRSYLRTLATVYEGGPAGVRAIAASLSEDSGTLEAVVEPFLLQLGFVARTERGRTLTRQACEHLGLAYKEPASRSNSSLLDSDA